METKNFLFSQAQRKNKPFKFVSLFCVALLLSACGTLKTREELKSKPTDVPGQVGKPPTPTKQEPPVVLPPPVSTPQPVPVPAPAPESFLTKEPPKVGLILGPGGMRSFAHIGVLRELSRARVPIHSIVGLEWGAVMASLFAIQGQANEVEWKAFRLKEGELPDRSLLTRMIEPANPTRLKDFLSAAYGTQMIEKTKVEFACPAYQVAADRFGWWNSGSMRDGVARCLAYPPFFTPSGGWLASPFSIEDAAAYLRSKGANLIIYVNVLASGEVLATSLQERHYADYVLWSEIRRQSNRKQIPGVNTIISILTAPHDITSFASRRQLLDAGARASLEPIKNLSKQYGF